MTSKKLSPIRLKDIETGRKEERKLIVEWLRKTADIFEQEIIASKKRDTSEYLHHQQSCTRAADAIEGGEHLL